MKCFRFTSLIGTLLAIIVVLVGCQSTPNPTATLGKYEGFRNGPKGGVDKIWTPPNITSPAQINAAFRPYKRILIDPVILSLKNKDSYDGIDPSDLYRLAKDFEIELKAKLQSKYKLETNPGPGILRISVALVGVESPGHVMATVGTILPVGLLFSVASKAITGEHLNVGSATMEVVFSDSQSRKTILAAIDRRSGKKNLGNITDKFNAAREAFKWWATRLRLTLDRVHN